MPKKYYTLRFFNADNLTERANVSFESLSDSVALRRVPKIAREVQSTRSPWRLSKSTPQGNQLVSEGWPS